MKKPLLKIKDVDIGYIKSSNKNLVQSELNLALNAGELICLIGPNGVGKSTLLKTLGRVIPKLAGEIKIFGQNLQELSQRDFAQNIGLVLTDNIEVSHIKAIDIISMGRYPYTGFLAKLKQADIEIVKSVAQEVGIQNLLYRYFNELSDGEKQKVMIAKVLAQKTPLMLLDEPTAFLDFPTKSSLLIMLRKLAREQNIGIILSTHDIELALKTADQIWLFPEHNNMVHGAPEDLVLNGDILKVFQNSDMTFDMHTGHFEKVIHAKSSISVKGEGPQEFWLKKALLRNDIENNEASNWKIEYHESYEIYYQKELKTKVTSIEEVLKYIKIH